MKNSLSVRSALTVLCGVVVVGIIGCDQPIYRTAPNSMVTAASVANSSGGDSTSNDVDQDDERYQWPLSRNGYMVARPPRMAYITSMSEKIAIPDPVTAKVVPWDESKLSARSNEYLHLAFDEFDLTPEPNLSISLAELAGPLAYDVSADGSRVVAIDDEGIALYTVATSKLVGHMQPPTEVVAAGGAIRAVRFVGDQNDMVVATKNSLFGISGKTGKVTSRCACPVDTLAQWQVAQGGEFMMIRTAGGKIFTGKTDLSDFRLCGTPESAAFTSASISSDGKRLGTVMKGADADVFLRKQHIGRPTGLGRRFFSRRRRAPDSRVHGLRD